MFCVDLRTALTDWFFIAEMDAIFGHVFYSSYGTCVRLFVRVTGVAISGYFEMHLLSSAC
jgi:hypothetical protein